MRRFIPLLAASLFALVLLMAGCSGTASGESNDANSESAAQSGDGEATNASSDGEATKEEITQANIEDKLLEQDIYCEGFSCVNDYRQYSTIEGATVYAGTVTNNTDMDITTVHIAVCGWNDEGWPIEWDYFPTLDADLSGNSTKYMAHLEWDDACLSAHSQIEGVRGDQSYAWTNNGNPTEATQFRYIVASADCLDGTTWTNPLLDEWVEVYCSQKLE